MSRLIDRTAVQRVIAALDAQIYQLQQEAHKAKVHLDNVRTQERHQTTRSRLLRELLEADSELEQTAALLGVPIPAQAVEEEEEMYLGATPEESLQGGGSVDPTF